MGFGSKSRTDKPASLIKVDEAFGPVVCGNDQRCNAAACSRDSPSSASRRVGNAWSELRLVWEQSESGRVRHPFEPVILAATLAMIPVLIIERDATVGWLADVRADRELG